MRNKDKYKGKNITVIGLARSGLACARLLHDLGAHVSVTDSRDTESIRKLLPQLPADIPVELGAHSPGFIRGRDLVVVSPGVPRNAEPAVWAQEAGIPVVSEIEVAWNLCPATVIAVTGSVGKTTVTTLIGNMLEACGKKVFVCGNIGTPFSGELPKIGQRDFVCLEVSSFQLERIRDFKPKIAVILNVVPNHLDRHRDMDEYAQAKKRIFMNQDATDQLIVNADDPVAKELVRGGASQVSYFSRTDELNANQAAVQAVGRILCVKDEVVREVFDTFTGIEHRLEYVTTVNDVQFLNDSKATTVESARWALENIKRPVVLIAGGRHKGVDYRTLLDAARTKVKAVVLIGEAKTHIRQALSGHLPCEDALTLEDAVNTAFHKAQPGDCVLLSPMCSSYDMFTDYEERGRKFKEVVASLAAGHGVPAHTVKAGIGHKAGVPVPKKHVKKPHS